VRFIEIYDLRLITVADNTRLQSGTDNKKFPSAAAAASIARGANNNKKLLSSLFTK
jgi:hypothetical protein